jgi:hypothetical protein
MNKKYSAIRIEAVSYWALGKRSFCHSLISTQGKQEAEVIWRPFLGMMLENKA